MIFTTKNKELAIFGNTIDDIKNKIDKFNEIKIKNGLFGENGAFTSLFSGKKSNNILSLEVLNQFEEFKEKFNSSSLSAEALAEQMENVDQRIIDYAKTCKNGEMTTEGFKASIDTMSFSAKAGKVALQGLATVGNMLAGWIITKALQAAVTAIDNWIHRVEKANEAMKEAVNEYESAKSSLENVNSELSEQNKKIDELLSKDKLTYAEKGQLEELQAITQELLLQQNIEEKRAANASKEAADKAIDAYKKQYGRYDNTEDDLQEKLSYENFPIPEDTDDVLGMIAAYIRAQELLEQSQKELDNAVKNGEDTTWLADNVQFNIDMIDDYRQSLDENISDLQEKRLALEDEYNKTIEKRESGVEPLTSSEKEVIETYESIYDVMRMVYEYTDKNTWKSMQIESVFDTEGIEKTKEELIEMVKAGEFDESTLQSYPKLSEALEQNKVSADELRNELEALAEAEKYIQNSPFNNESDTSFSIEEYEEQIDAIQSSISTLRSALDSFNNGEMDKEGVLDLMQEFPALTKYIDLTADGFGNLSEGLSELISQQPDALIQSLESMKSMLNTEAEREQVDLLIDSLQRLSSYGDSGIEAYATATGSTWNDTANVIEGVTTQFENLAKVQEAVSDGLTVSAIAAAELANMYPEILTQSEVTADGQIKLNEDVVKSILAGDQSIINAQITKLEADKAELEARKETAIAKLELANQVATGEIELTEEELRLKIEAMDQELEKSLDKDRQISESFADAVEATVTNLGIMDENAGKAANDIAVNMGNAAKSMADSMAQNAGAVQNSLSGIMKKTADVARSIAAMISGEVAGNADTIYGGSNGKNGRGINVVNTVAKNAGTVTGSYAKRDLTLDELRSGLQVDISNYEAAISNIDTQIGVLKNLQLTFEDTVNSANGGIGGHNYADRIKELEKEKDAVNNAINDSSSGSGSGSDSSASDEFEEMIDFYERRVDVLNQALDLLKAGMENVTGSFAKNNLVSAELEITEEQFRNCTDAMAMYTQKANEALAKLPADIAEKVKNGAVDLTTFIGDGNEAVTDAISEYQDWADKVADCRQELEELKTAIRQLELEKFNNIMDDFSDQFDLRDDANSLIDKQIALLQEAGQLIGESFYTAQADQTKKQLATLEEEKAKLVEQLNSAIGSGRVNRCALFHSNVIQ